MPQKNADSDSTLFDEMVSEFSRLVREGKSPNVEEFANRNAELASRVRRQFPLLAMMELHGESWSSSEVDLPSPELALASSQKDKWKAPERLGDFRLIRQIGRGGMGVVYEAEQESLGRRVAVKILPASAQFDERRVERFATEARASAMLHHTNIVPVFGVGREDGLSFYVMQLIEGEPLNRVLRDIARIRDLSTKPLEQNDESTFSNDEIVRSMFGEPNVRQVHDYSGASQNNRQPTIDSSTPEHAASEADSPTRSSGVRGLVGSGSESGSLLNSDEGKAAGSRTHNYFRNVARVGIEVSQALEHAHGHGILHRDIKPSNLLLDADGAVWVTDFGLAKHFDSPDITRTGEVVGTLRYMSPEQLNGNATPNSDIFGLGLTLYEMLTLQPAYPGIDKKRLLEKVAEANPANPRSIDSRIPRDLETIVMKCIHFDPSKRYASATEVKEDLSRFLDGQPIHARRIDVFEKAWKWCCRRPALAMTMAALAGSILIGLSGISWQWSKAVNALEDSRIATAKAEKHFNQAREAVAQITEAISEDQLLATPELQTIRGKLLEKALTYQVNFANKYKDDAEIQIDLARGYENLASVSFETGSSDTALGHLEDAEGILRNLMDRELLAEERRKARVCLSDTLAMKGAILVRRSPKGRDYFLEAKNVVLDGRGDPELSPPELASLARIHQRLGISAEAANAGRLVGSDQADEGALEHYERAFELISQIPDGSETVRDKGQMLGTIHRDLAIAFRRLKDYEKALFHYTAAVEQFRKLVKKDAGNTDYQYGLAEALSSLGYYYGFAEYKQEMGVSFYKQAIAEYKRLSQKHPSVLRFTESEVRAALNCGMLCEDEGDWEDAFKFRASAVQLSERMLLFAPDSPKLLSGYGKALVGLGVNCAHRDDIETALSFFAKGKEQHEKAIAKYPKLPILRVRLIHSILQSAQTHRDTGSYALSLEHCKEAASHEPILESHYLAGRELLRLALEIKVAVSDADTAELAIADESIKKAKELFSKLSGPAYNVHSRILDDQSFDEVVASDLGTKFLDWLETEQVRVADSSNTSAK